MKTLKQLMGFHTSFKNELEVFINAIQTRKSPITNYKEAIGVQTVMEMIENKHAKIKDYFYKGVIAGQIIQWEEANLVINCAEEFCRVHNITTLTVHDEFIVEEKHQPMIKDFMYSSGYSPICSKYSLMDRIKHM